MKFLLQPTAEVPYDALCALYGVGTAAFSNDDEITAELPDDPRLATGALYGWYRLPVLAEGADYAAYLDVARRSQEG